MLSYGETNQLKIEKHKNSHIAKAIVLIIYSKLKGINCQFVCHFSIF